MKRKMPKSYTTGMIVLLFLSAMYLVIYPFFQKQEEEQALQAEDAAAQAIQAIEAAEAAKEEAEASDDQSETVTEEIDTQDEQPDTMKEDVDEPDDQAETYSEEAEAEAGADEVYYEFRSNKKFEDHYDKHGIEMGFATPQEYLDAANALINNPNALHKYEKEDGDDIYYLESTDEIAFVSQDGYLRTYFICSGKSYYDRQ